MRDRKDDMNREHIIEVLAGLLVMETDTMPTIEGQDSLVISVPDTFDDDDKYYYRYHIINEEKIRIEKLVNGQTFGEYFEKSLRQIIWKSCKLDRVCSLYSEQYEEWKTENNNIPYIETQINDESDGRPERAFDFIRGFWKEEVSENEDNSRNMRLLLAEYGQGKSSYCQGIRHLAAKEIKPLFMKERAAFPFVFDLNRFRSGDFDKFIESELFGTYKVSLDYRTFERLCQSGFFMVVLDAWDQMHSARKPYQVKQDLKQMNSLWEKNGRALITCRRSFYQQQLKIKGNLSKNVGLYKLNGFDKEAAKDYLCNSNEKRKKKGMPPLVQSESEWIDTVWALNSDLFEKPLNLKLLVKHFDIITKQLDFKNSGVETDRFLDIIYQEWREKNNIKDDKFLKELISQTLFSGLNRSILLEQFKQACEENKWEQIFKALQEFDFIKIDEREGRIEFRLAAYQEFIWAHFALQELETEPEILRNANALIKNYLLIREVREWICTILGKEKSNCLKCQLEYVKFRKKEEVGYIGANALTLLFDLIRYKYYKEQFENIKSDLCRRPLMGADLRGMDLSDCDFHGSNFEGADLSFTVLDRSNFGGTDLAQVIWDEHGEMKKCAFLNQKDTLCVVAGTQNGGVLTYGIDDGNQKVVNLQNDMINDLAGDRGGIYTASSDGWVGYIDRSGNLRNAYIAQSGLQSIAHTNSESCVYVGADNQGIYRYNWNTGTRQKIEVNEVLGDGAGRISDIHYYSSSEGEDYVAYTLQDNRLLVLLKLTGICRGEVIAKGILCTQGRKFGDICFADEMLVYSITGRGIFGMPIKEVIGDILERELLNEQQMLLPMRGAERFSLGWANAIKKLMAIAADEQAELRHIYSIDPYSQEYRYTEIELEWYYKKRNYRIPLDNIKGFAVSEDGEYIAFAGISLSVFHKEAGFYSLLRKPIEAKISCEKADFSGCIGLNSYRENFLKERKANLGTK